MITTPQVDRIFWDYFAVTYSVQMSKPATSVKEYNDRNLKAVNIDQLRKDLRDSELYSYAHSEPSHHSQNQSCNCKATPTMV